MEKNGAGEGDRKFQGWGVGLRIGLLRRGHLNKDLWCLFYMAGGSQASHQSSICVGAISKKTSQPFSSEIPSQVTQTHTHTTTVVNSRPWKASSLLSKNLWSERLGVMLPQLQAPACHLHAFVQFSLTLSSRYSRKIPLQGLFPPPSLPQVFKCSEWQI